MKKFAAIAADGTVIFTTSSVEDCPLAAGDIRYVEVERDFNAAGQLWDGSTFSAGLSAASQALLLASIRKHRADCLALCDWTQVSDAPLTASQRTAWAAYRQSLRDLPSQPGFPASVTWPTPP